MKVSTASTIAAWVPVVLRCLKHHGMAKQHALTLAGIDPAKLSQQGARYNSQQTHKLMAVLDSTLDVAVPGLELARFTDATSFGALGFAMMASTTLAEALSRLQRFAPVASSVVAFEVYTHDALGEIRIEDGSGAPSKKFTFIKSSPMDKFSIIRAFIVVSLKGCKAATACFLMPSLLTCLSSRRPHMRLFKTRL